MAAPRVSLLPLLVLPLLFAAALPAGAAPPTQVSLQIVPARDGPRPYPVWAQYPFQLTAKGSYTLDEETEKLVSAGQAAVSTSYAWKYAPAQLVLASPDWTWAEFLYDEKCAETDQTISVTYTVTVTYLAALQRSPDEATATDTLPIDVIGTGGGLRQDAELFVEPADQDGEVCDRVEVRVKVYKPDLFDTLWWRRPGQDWSQVGAAKGEETPQFIVYTYVWLSERDKNVGMDWKATYWRLQFFPPPPQQVLLETDPETWTPNNTVVGGSDKVLKWDPEVPANCDTDATFDLSHLDYDDPDWDVTVKIYNAAGGLVKTLVEEGGFQLGENTVTWDGKNDAQATVPTGIYTYTVEAVHQNVLECRDTDKSTHLAISGTSFTEWNADWVTRKVTAKVGYTLSQAAQSTQVRVFGPDLSLLYTGGGLATAQGQHTTDEFTFDMPADDGAYGTYTAVVDALETDATAEAHNRDLQPKWAPQGMGAREIPFYMHFNVDNDDASGNAQPNAHYPGGDYAQEEQVTGEDDLRLFAVRLGDPPANGKVRLVRGSDILRVWKADNKGDPATNLLAFDGNNMKTWDLGVEGQPEDWASWKNNLYVEGHGKGTTTLALQYLDANNIPVTWDSKTYDFIDADCGNQPRTQAPPDNQRARFKGAFGGLVHCEWSVTAASTNAYNCIAWSVLETNVWWNPDVDVPNTNIKGIHEHYGEPGSTLQEDLDAFYLNENAGVTGGYSPTATGPSDAVVMYYAGYHAARRKGCTCGGVRWTMFESKIGGWEKIEHVWDQLDGTLAPPNGPGYGARDRYYK